MLFRKFGQLVVFKLYKAILGVHASFDIETFMEGFHELFSHSNKLTLRSGGGRVLHC